MAGLTVRAVATEAGVAPMGVYNHFSDKGGLLLAVLTAAFDQLATDTAWRADLAPRAALREVGHGYRRFALARPTTYELMFGTGARLSRAVERAGDHSDRAFDRLLHAVQACQHLGIVRHGEPAVMAMTIWSAVHGAVSLETSGCMPPGFDGEDAFATVLDMIDRGLAPSAAG